MISMFEYHDSILHKNESNGVLSRWIQSKIKTA